MLCGTLAKPNMFIAWLPGAMKAASKRSATSCVNNPNYSHIDVITIRDHEEAKRTQSLKSFQNSSVFQGLQVKVESLKP